MLRVAIGWLLYGKLQDFHNIHIGQMKRSSWNPVFLFIFSSSMKKNNFYTTTNRTKPEMLILDITRTDCNWWKSYSLGHWEQLCPSNKKISNSFLIFHIILAALPYLFPPPLLNSWLGNYLDLSFFCLDFSSTMSSLC